MRSKSFNRFLAMIMAMIMVIVAMPTGILAETTEIEVAEEVTETETVTESLWEIEAYGNGVALTKYNGTDTDVLAPATVTVNGEEKTVIKLGDRLFADNDTINSVTLAEGIVEIGEGAFFGADALVCIVTNNSLTAIGDDAFYSCDQFNSVILSDNVVNIGTNVFGDCPKLTVWCNEDSTAYKYVTENNVNYSIINPSATPDTVEIDGVSYYVQNGEAIAIDYIGEASEISIPSTINGFPVIELKGTFEYATSIVKVILPDSLKRIANNTFKGCNNLQEINIPDTVNMLGSYAFSGCRSLLAINIPNDITVIEEYTFSGCSVLTNIIIPEGITSIGDYAFQACYGLVDVTIPESITNIGKGAFQRCEKLAAINIPKKLKTLGASSFEECSNLSTIEIPSTVSSINSKAFYNCSKLSSITISEGVKSIDLSAFANCSELQVLTIPLSVTELQYDKSLCITSVLAVYENTCSHTVADENNLIYYINDGINPAPFITTDDFTYLIKDNKAIVVRYNGSQTEITVPAIVDEYPVVEIGKIFKDDSSFTQIILPEGLEVIGHHSFRNVKISNLNLPSTVKTIGNYAFYNWGLNSQSVNLPSEIVSIGDYAFEYAPFSNDLVLPETLEYLGEGAFEYSVFLKSVTIPGSVKSINKKAFNSCMGLESITLCEGITSMDLSAFNDCTNLNVLIVPESVVNMSKSSSSSFYGSETILAVYEKSYAHSFAIENDLLYSVYDGKNLPQLTTLNNVTYIVNGKSATAIKSEIFLQKISIPSSVNGLPVEELRSTFNMSSIKEVTLPWGLKIIGKNTFKDCNNLSSINIPSSVTTIGNHSFEGCSQITEINIPYSVTSIGDNAFSRCTNLTNVYIPSSLSELGDAIFYGCSSLTEINLPHSIIKINDSAFRDCYNLTTVNIPSSVSEIESFAFYGCSHLTEINIPSSVTQIGAASFSYSGIKEINFPDARIDLGDSSFSWCHNLTKISIPASIDSINKECFRGCSNLSSVTISEGTTSIDLSAFADCPKLYSLLIPQSVTKMYTTSYTFNTILVVYENSYAHSFAVENDLLYYVLQKAENPEVHFGTSISGFATYPDGNIAANVSVEILYDDGTVKEVVATDENGVYTFTYAEVGKYTLRVTDSEGNTASTKISVKRMNAFDVFLAGDTSLTLKKAYTISGTLENVDSASITLSDTEGNILFATEAINGNFTLVNVPNGTYILKAETENGSVTKEITVFEGNISDLTLTVDTSSATIWGYVEVQEREGNNKRRIWIDLTIYNEEGIAVAQTKSDKDGKYQFKNLPIGEYTIVAETEEMRPDRENHYNRNHRLTGYSYIVVDDIGTYEVDTIVLYEDNGKSTTISGKVTAQGESQQCEIILTNVFRHEIAKYTTKQNGKYSFVNVSDGFYFITATTESDGMGFATVLVVDGIVYGETSILVCKSDKVRDREIKFFEEIPELTGREDAEAWRDRIAEEKRFYDGLSNKEKKQLSKKYVEHLNRYIEWLSNCNYTSDDGVAFEGGMVVSGYELEQGNSVSFTITVEKQEKWADNMYEVTDSKDYLHNNMKDTAGNNEIVEYYEISMTKTVDGEDKTITSVLKDTDAMGKFRVTLEIPEEYRGHKHYSILHVHCGEVITLTDLDDDPNTITIEVDAFSTFALTMTDEELFAELFSTGDLNNDGNVDSDDAIYLLRYTFFPDTYPINQSGDFDGNGKVDSDDAIYLLRHTLLPDSYPLD